MRHLAFAAVLAASAPCVFAADRLDTQQQLDELRQRQDAIFEQLATERNKVRTFLNDTLYVGGFLDTGITGIWGPDTATQFSAATTNAALNLAADPGGNIRFNSQLLFTPSFPLENSNNSPDGPLVGLPPTREFGVFSSDVAIPQAYLEYDAAPAVNIQFGRGYVPFGIAFQERDFVQFRRRGGPQMIQANYPDKIAIASSVWTGLHLSGAFRLGERRLGYDVYSITPTSDPRTLGGGARAWLEISKALTVGASTQSGKRDGSPYEAVGGDISLKISSIGVEAEYAANYGSSGASVVRSFYVEPYYTFLSEHFLIYAAVDYLGNPDGEVYDTGALPDPFEKWEFGGGLNWLPYDFTRFRLGILFNDYTGSNANPQGVDRDFYSLDISGGVEF